MSVTADRAAVRGAHPGLTAILITLGGLAFNALRVQVRLDQGPWIDTVIAFLLLGGAAALLANRLGMTQEDLGIRRPGLAPALIGGGLCATVLIGSAVLTAPMLHLPTIAQLGEGIVLYVLLIAPSEELLFRGVLYGVVETAYGARTAVISTAASFAIIHAPVYGLKMLPLAMVAGLMLGWLRWWSRSLLPSTAVHAAADLALLWL